MAPIRAGRGILNAHMGREGTLLLTGGAGFIGSHLAEALLRRGARLAILDRLDEFYSPEWKRANLADLHRAGHFEFVPADICDLGALRAAFEKTRPAAVIHLAARAGVRPSIEQPLLYERVNIGGTLNLLELCREFRVPKFLFGSSSSVYGATARAPFSEDQSELRPISPYAATKLAGEMLCYTYAHLFGLTAVCLRFFTVYGPRQRPDLAIHKFTALLEAEKPLPIFGDGSTGRDFTYVDDIVAGLLAALDYEPATRPRFEVFNLGNSHPVRLAELVEALERATGRKARRVAKPAQPGDVPLTWADLSKSKRLLGYEPQTSLDEGLRRFVAWYRATDPARRA
jgi:UDP-glucuronate 4-epimerase